MGRTNWPEASFVSGLPDAERAALLGAGTPVRFADDQILLVQGDGADFLYVLTSGLVKIIVAAESGAQATIAIRSQGDLLGEFALLDNRPRTATARACGPVTALKIGASAFTALAGRSPAIQTAVTRYVLAKMRATTERHAAERVWDARERICQVLYELGREHGKTDAGGATRLPLTQSELGDLVGVAVSTVERVLKDLRRERAVITRYGEIVIRDMAYLARIRFPQKGIENPLPSGIMLRARKLAETAGDPRSYAVRQVRRDCSAAVAGAASTHSPGVWAISETPGPYLTAGMPSSANLATSVQPGQDLAH